MYEDLINNLRICSRCDFGQGCNGCAQKSDDAFCCDKLLHQAANAIEELMRRCEQFQYMPLPAWIPVTERLPETGKKVLVFAYGHDVLTARLRKETENGYPVFECNGICSMSLILEMAKQGRITHWIQLPEPPEEGI